MSDAETDSEADGRDETVSDCADGWDPGTQFEREVGQASAQTDAFEHLVEDDDDEEDVEVVGRAERDADDYGVWRMSDTIRA